MCIVGTMTVTSHNLESSPVGEEHTDADAVIETHDPRSNTLLAIVADQSPAEVAEAIERARAAFPEWSALSFKDRADHLLTVRERLLDRAEEFVDIICSETGKQPAEAVTTELMTVCESIGWYAKNGRQALRRVDVAPGLMAHKKAWKQYEPMGVIGAISPWNYPFVLAMTPIITALFAGNTVVAKPSEVTPTVGLAIAELFEDEIWGDIVQVVTGGGATGAALVAGGVDKVVFTGSVATGKRVMAAAAENLTPVLLELGGKDPMVVCEDADLGRASKAAVWGAFQNSGQTCMSVERVYVAEKVYDRFVERVVDETRKIRQTADGAGDIGSMTFAPQLEKVEAHIADATAKGATVLTGGSRIDRDGLWFEPTVLTNVDHTMDIMVDETFGPVLPIMAVADAKEAIALANDSEYGLNSSVWSRNLEYAESLASQMQAGNVCINDCIVSYGVVGLPFGGVKGSGIGRVHGVEGLREFSNLKSVLGQKNLPIKREPWWYPIPKGMDRVGIASLRLRFSRSMKGRMRGFRRG
jgi:acyl-CoA reductase-like NAD-dependent aldehyde dehydrogenase